MKNRQILIISALAVPVIGLIALTHSGKEKPAQIAAQAVKAAAKPGPKRPPIVLRTKDQALVDIKKRLDRADAMTDEQYAKFKAHKNDAPATLQEYRSKTKKRFDDVQAMTEEQWKEDEKSRVYHTARPAKRPATASQPATASEPSKAAGSAVSKTASEPAKN